MGIKRVVDIDFWTDDKVVELFSPEDKLFMLYLMTNPHTTQLGIYSLNKKIMAFELGYSVEAVSVLLDRFETKYNIIKYSKETNEIALKNSLKHSIVKGGKPVEDLLIKEIQKVKNKSLLSFVYGGLANQDNLNKTVAVILEKIKDVIEYDNVNDNDNDVSYHDSYDDSLEEGKKVKKRIKQKASPYTEVINSYTDNEMLKKSINEFIKMRKTIKAPLTEDALNLMLNKLDKFTTNEDIKILILNQSIMNCWKGIYELKSERSDNNNGNNTVNSRSNAEDKFKDWQPSGGYNF